MNQKKKKKKKKKKHLKENSPRFTIFKADDAFKTNYFGKGHPGASHQVIPNPWPYANFGARFSLFCTTIAKPRDLWFIPVHGFCCFFPPLVE